MTAAIPAELRQIAERLDAIAREISRMVPDNAERDDHVLLAANDIWAAKRCSLDGATRLTWAIREQMGGMEHADD